MWQFAIPLVLTACDGGDATMLAVVGALVLFVLQQQKRSPHSRTLSPSPSASARVAKQEEDPPERVPNPRKSTVDVTTVDHEGVRVPTSHIAGVIVQPSKESRARLMTRQREEMKAYRLHPYE